MKQEHELTLILMDEGKDFQEARSYIKNNYVGKFSTMYDFVTSYIEEFNVASEQVKRYIDLEAMGRDLLLVGYTAFKDKELNVHIFTD